MKRTTHPFGRAVAEQLLENGYVRLNSNPDWVTFATTIPGVSYETLRKAVSGERPVSPELLKKVAQALRIEPSFFVEYRLANARRELDPTEVGWQRAVAALSSWERFVQAQAGGTTTLDSEDTP